METTQTKQFRKNKQAQSIELFEGYDSQLNYNSYNAHRGQDTIFCAMKLLDKKYTSTVWSITPFIKRADSLCHLEEFYRQLIHGKDNQLNIYVTNFPLSIVDRHNISPELSILELTKSATLSKLSEFPDKETKTAIFHSEYADFGIEFPSSSDYRRLDIRVPPRLERIMFTRSKHDISESLAKLISSTSRFEVKESELINHLREAHTF